jgi:PIN domain nuclease of toxin-antitoxin system
VRFLVDTHILLWAATAPHLLPAQARGIIEEGADELVFSVVSLWELAIKRAKHGRSASLVDPHLLRAGLLASSYEELPVLGSHALAVSGLAALHHDPFDRLMLAQAMAEGMVLLTSDRVLGRYPGPVRLV